ncbi:ABC transporter ATP-binding protein [Dongia sp. agr-C8]
MTPDTILEVRNLSVAYRQGGGWSRAVDDVSFALKKGEVFGLVGESGCGKSTVSLQLLGYRHPSMKAEAGQVLFKGQNLLALSRPELDRLRGEKIAFIPQNPTTALNPGIRIGRQVSETMVAHGRAKDLGGADQVVGKYLKLVGLPVDPGFLRRYPHQLSGGQQQRVCIAMALCCDPDLLVLDEPTTGLDVTTQEQIVSLLIALRARIGLSMLYVTHDLALLSQIADRIGVMYAGKMVEVAPTDMIFTAPKHPYTRGLIGSIPRIDFVTAERERPLRSLLRRGELPAGCPFSPRCDFAQDRCFAEPQRSERTGPDSTVACWRWQEIAPLPSEPIEVPSLPRATGEMPLLSIDKLDIHYGRGEKAFRAVSDVSFAIRQGEVFALVGESGSGKSTIARAISGLVPPAGGTVALDGRPLAERVNRRSSDERRRIQYIFQNPDASLNPRARVGETIARPLHYFFHLDRAQARRTVAEALADVQLDGSYAARFPDQLSGGERQRVAIARALAAEPSLLLCDEILSALDVSVQASILKLLQKLKAHHAIAMLFISHDLAVVRMLADHVCVLYGGEVMEVGPVERIFASPFHPYTHTLLHAVPVPLQPPATGDTAKTGEPKRGSPGCVFAGRCPWKIGAICDTTRPPWRESTGGLRLRCHHNIDKLNELADWPPEPAAANTSRRTRTNHENRVD